MTPDEARGHIGGRVAHRIGTVGVIAAVTDAWVFVCYDGDAGSMRTDPADLEVLPAG